MNIVVLGPHFDPDTAPTGRVLSRIVSELARRGHRVHVVAALPWYRDHAVEAGWEARLGRRQQVEWGTITRVNPFPGDDKRNLVRRALGFAGFSVLAGAAGVLAGGVGQRVDAVIAMSPPLTLGLTGRLVAWSHRAPLVFNIQDVFPDAAVRTGAITNRRVIAVASWLERLSYRSSDAVTVLSDDLAANVRGKLPGRRRGRDRADRVHMIPNFVDTDAIRPAERMTPYRAELGIGDEPVVLYAGNVGFSQSLDLMLAAARRLPQATFLINGEGSMRAELVERAAGLGNVRFGHYVPDHRLVELLATGDIHVVPLRAGLANVSVPSKTYSILAAGRPVVAAIDPGTEVPRILEASGAGIAVAPDDADAFTHALQSLLDDPARCAGLGAAGRAWVEEAASPAAVAASYERLIESLH
ncbi:glycosyltransferase family 4 protein [Desertimonas flava]|jgi:colanic acid biosynthesis glycosyl transferase WcaI|uniref:glycosyltransferase family 4 protein n=1 Tax=Desertimonas flava TaxID=2064846 RepID=UPI000E342A67|nr:glycosyltransferase family 4 protein [Desertimonas flava]